jgi:hypothetical protein
VSQAPVEERNNFRFEPSHKVLAIATLHYFKLRGIFIPPKNISQKICATR